MTVAAALVLFQPSGSSGISQTIGLYVLIIGIFYFVLLRPQQQQRKRHEESLRAVKKGDEIVTAGGLIGEIVHIKPVGAEGATSEQDRITIRSGESRLVIERGKIARIITPQITEAKGSGGSA
jgi:preprotein translocase subunit YajC